MRPQKPKSRVTASQTRWDQDPALFMIKSRVGTEHACIWAAFKIVAAIILYIKLY